MQRFQEDGEDLTNKLKEEEGMAETVAAKAMHEPQELAMLKDKFKEVMEDANEMADLIREYESREEKQLALESAKKELVKVKILERKVLHRLTLLCAVCPDLTKFKRK